jgi:hypothetical protein
LQWHDERGPEQPLSQQRIPIFAVSLISDKVPIALVQSLCNDDHREIAKMWRFGNTRADDLKFRLLFLAHCWNPHRVPRDSGFWGAADPSVPHSQHPCHQLPREAIYFFHNPSNRRAAVRV